MTLIGWKLLYEGWWNKREESSQKNLVRLCQAGCEESGPVPRGCSLGTNAEERSWSSSGQLAILRNIHITDYVNSYIIRQMFSCIDNKCISPSVLLHRWLGNRNGIGPVKNCVLACWWWHFDWSFACLIAPVATITSITLSSNKIQNGEFWYWLTKVHLWNGR